jgi:hypothetical protein
MPGKLYFTIQSSLPVGSSEGDRPGVTTDLRDPSRRELVTIPTHEEQQQAKETLAYIRRTMESASTFTAVSGWALVIVGAIALVASWLAWAAGQAAPLEIWIPTAVVAFMVSAVGSAVKARRLEVPLWSGAFQKMVWGMAPALGAGGLLTLALTTHGSAHLLPGTWLALYGAGVTASGTFSVQAVRWMGLTMLVFGGIALLQTSVGLWCLALGFGGAHLAFGFYIVQRHGG